MILRDYVDRGLVSVFEPLNGYFILIARLMSLAAFKASFLWAPELSAALAVALTCAVIVAIALSPTLLPRPYLFAIVPLVIPSDPEVFNVALYSVWWAGVLLLLVLIWDSDRGKLWLRVAYTVVGGLSSPLIVPFAAILWLRVLIMRRLSELVTAAVAGAFAAIQTIAVTSSQIVPHRPPPDPLAVADTFAGIFVATPRNWLSELHPGLYVLSILAVAAFLARRKLRWEITLLALAWIAVCFSAYLRLGEVRVLSPVGAGPRYFFFPLIIMIWIGLWIALQSSTWMRAIMGLGLALALSFAGRQMARYHDPIDWRAEVTACARADAYKLPIHFDGIREHLWHIALTGAQCQAMLKDSFFGALWPVLSINDR